MSRKTVELNELVEMVNKLNRESTCSLLTREGWNTFLEDILYKTGRYQGYGFLKQREVPPGEKAGLESVNGKNTFPDESRRFYY